jgi:hypothetical protein
MAETITPRSGFPEASLTTPVTLAPHALTPLHTSAAAIPNTLNLFIIFLLPSFG